MTQAEQLKKVKELAEDIRIGMFVTQGKGNKLYSRPMSISEVDEAGAFWFFTELDSAKVDEIRQYPHVNISFSKISSNDYLSVNGLAHVVNDQAKIDELWSDFLKVWFPKGKNSPNLTLLKVAPETTEYWDGVGNGVAQGFYMAKAFLTGKKYEEVTPSENKTVEY